MSDKKLELVDKATERKAQLPVRNGTIGPSVVDISALFVTLLAGNRTGERSCALIRRTDHVTLFGRAPGATSARVAPDPF